MTGDPENFIEIEMLAKKLSSMKVEGRHIELYSENTVCCRTFGGHCIYFNVSSFAREENNGMSVESDSYLPSNIKNGIVTILLLS